MRLVAGLGNPGKKYEGTRHNVGFEVLDYLVKRWESSQPKARFQARTSEAIIEGERVLLLWPMTFMNRSGSAVAAAMAFFKLDIADLLVICDDINLPLARLRLRARGSSGGQKGLADILHALGTEEVPRLRIGIGGPPAGCDATDFVLGKFSPKERIEMDLCVTRAGDAVSDWVNRGLAYCMNKYN